MVILSGYGTYVPYPVEVDPNLERKGGLHDPRVKTDSVAPSNIAAIMGGPCGPPNNETEPI
jgi:hypothetical protein